MTCTLWFLQVGALSLFTDSFHIFHSPFAAVGGAIGGVVTVTVILMGIIIIIAMVVMMKCQRHDTGGEQGKLQVYINLAI